METSYMGVVVMIALTRKTEDAGLDDDVDGECKLRIDIIGPLRIRRGDIALSAADLGGPKPRQVLEILLLSLGSAVSKNRIMELLWEGRHPAVAQPTLESYVSVLRRHLQPGTGRSGPIRTVTGGYIVDRSAVDLDLDRFQVLTTRAAHAEPVQALAFLSEALELAHAPLLGDELLPAWAEEERALHATQVAGTRVLAAETALAVGDAGKAIAWARAAVQEDQLSERAWAALILGLEQQGENTEALRCLDRCRRILDEEMGCAPGPVLKAAQARLLGSTSGVDTAAAPAQATQPLQVVPPSAPPVPEHGPAEQAAGRLRILTVDDHTTFAELLNGALDREPDFMSVGSAKTVEEAVRMFQELRPDLVIMDLHLADGSGLDAAGRILAEAPATRIVMLTGNPRQEALREAAVLGICAFLPKDGALGTMLDTLRYARAGNMIVHPALVAQLGQGAPEHKLQSA
ncbi:histidine kinase [Arthrobacter sp. SW1]|nr:histidine kinase [Arthrobacter sp. SW1]